MLYGAFGLGRNNMLFWFLVFVGVSVAIGVVVAGLEK